MLVIGSEALKNNISLPKGREVKDVDFISTVSEFHDVFVYNWMRDDKIVHRKPTKWGATYFVKGNPPIEVEYAHLSPTGKELLELTGSMKGRKVADLDTLYALKMSHRYLKDSPHFLKTMNDIHYMRSYGVIIPKYLEDWFTRREKATYDYSHPSLKKNKENFFVSNVHYVYEHDDIHEIVAIVDRPAYTLYAKDGEEVQSCKKKFFELPYILRLNGVIEEAMVLAFERHQIPNYFMPDIKTSFEIALQKVCTSITSGWFREFAWENYNVAKNLGETYLQEKLNLIKKRIAEEKITIKDEEFHKKLKSLLD